MKKYALATLLILHTNIEQASPIDKSLLNQLCFKIASNKAFRACYKIGQIGTVVGIGYLFLQYLNAHRNPSHDSLIQYTPGDKYRPGTLNVHTDGHVTIQYHEEESFALQTNRQDPDSQDCSLFQEQAQPQQVKLSLRTIWALLQNFLHWIVQPANRAIIRHSASIPSNTNIVLTKYAGQISIHSNEAESKYAITDHTEKCDITINNRKIQPSQLTTPMHK